MANRYDVVMMKLTPSSPEFRQALTDEELKDLKDMYMDAIKWQTVRNAHKRKPAFAMTIAADLLNDDCIRGI